MDDARSITDGGSGEPIALPAAAAVERAARRGGIWSVAQVAARQPINLLATVFASRILTSDDYGLLGMAATSTALFQSFADLGLSWATIRDHELTRRQVDGLFWINVALGFLLWGATGAGGRALAAFYGRPELVGIAWVLGASFFLSGVAAQPAALLARGLRSRALFAAEIGGCLAGASAVVLGAALGWGCWALVAQILTTQGVRMSLLLALSGYRPGRPGHAEGVGRLVSFGGWMTAYGLVVYLSRNLDNILIGRVWGAAALGAYSRAYFLMTLPLMLSTAGLAGVMVPSLSSLMGDRERMGRAYRGGLRAVATLGLPIAGLLLIAAPEIVRLVYGDRWSEVVAPLRWLAVASALQTITATCGWLYLSLGEGRRMLLVGAATAAFQSLMFAAGVHHGVVGVATSYAVSTLLMAPLILLAAHRTAGLSLASTLSTLRAPLLGTVAAMMAALAASWGGSRVEAGPAALFAVKFAAGAAAYLAAGAVTADDFVALGLRRRAVPSGAAS